MMMDARDAETKTTFRIEKGIFHHLIILFDLKDIGATYQWVVLKMCDQLLGQVIIASINNMLVILSYYDEITFQFLISLVVLKELNMSHLRCYNIFIWIGFIDNGIYKKISK